MVFKLTPVKIRDVWATEDKAFTPWLVDNIDHLNDDIGLNIRDPQREEKLVNEVDIQSLRREKNQVKEVLSGLECGIGFYKFNEIQENDKLEFYLRVSNDKAK